MENAPSTSSSGSGRQQEGNAQASIEVADTQRSSLQQSQTWPTGAQVDANSSLQLTLSGIRLSFDNGKWRAASDLDIAAREINRVMDERDHAISNLHVAEMQIAALHKELLSVNKTKKAALDMLLEERKQKELLQQQLEGYQAELVDSYKTILELRKLLNLE